MQTGSKFVAHVATNGKSRVAIQFHRDGLLSFRNEDGHWTHQLAGLPASDIMKLPRYTRARLWYRNFRVERAWAEVHA
jgi:hypothetical protein